MKEDLRGDVKPMSKLHQQPETRPTLRAWAVEVRSLRERVEDLEDSRDLEEAIRNNDGTPLIPCEQAKQELGLD